MTQTALPKTIRYALFDFDGVIADTSPLYMELDRTALMHFGCTPTDEELRSFIGVPSEVAGPALLETKGIHVTTEQYLEVWNSDKGVYGSPELVPSEGLEELWHLLRRRGAKIAVVSTTRCVSLVRALNHFQLLSCVDAIVGREMVERQKPDPEPYLRALGLMAPGDPTAVEQAIAIDDSPTGVASAMGGGFFTICYQGASERRDVTGADLAVSSFSELAGLLG